MAEVKEIPQNQNVMSWLCPYSNTKSIINKIFELSIVKNMDADTKTGLKMAGTFFSSAMGAGVLCAF